MRRNNDQKTFRISIIAGLVVAFVSTSLILLSHIIQMIILVNTGQSISPEIIGNITSEVIVWASILLFTLWQKKEFKLKNLSA
jgi:hypothetical protein